jgi:hypothetical protein
LFAFVGVGCGLADDEPSPPAAPEYPMQDLCLDAITAYLEGELDMGAFELQDEIANFCSDWINDQYP